MNKIFEFTTNEFLRQKNSLNLIASENYPSPSVLKLLGEVWSNKYAEGYPGKRYYAGNINSDLLESFVQAKALEVFDKTGEYDVNVQVLSGSPANGMVYLSVLEAGDTIMSLNIANGGHISHLHPTSNYKKFFKLINYDVKDIGDNTYEIDLEDYTKKIVEAKPRLVVIGFSAYPRSYQFGEMCRIAHQNGCLVLADIAHINGLVAAGLHDTPFQTGSSGADFVSMTTHKTLRGPRGALLFAKKKYIKDINKTIFPGTSGGPHLHQIAATGQALLEILGEDTYPDQISFQKYSQNVISNCKTLENSLKANGLEVISPCQNHLCLVKLPDSVDSLEIQNKLEAANIITNRNTIPFDSKTPWRPSGMRFGSPALTSRGMTSEQFDQLGKLITDIIFNRQSQEDVSKKVSEIVESLNWWYTK
ncbi:MAG: serine hydroxymethyltransferase [Patescibacteria group bacterium]